MQMFQIGFFLVLTWTIYFFYKNHINILKFFKYCDVNIYETPLRRFQSREEIYIIYCRKPQDIAILFKGFIPLPYTRAMTEYSTVAELIQNLNWFKLLNILNLPERKI